jgi:DNA-binding IclR family transcriptional regulator
MSTARPPPETDPRSPPRAPARALLVLDLLARERAALSLSALSTRLGIPKTSAMHLLRALGDAAYVQRTSAGFELGTASYRLAKNIGTAGSFDEIAHPVLQAMLERTGETVLLGVIAEDQVSAVYTVRYPSTKAVRFAPETGERRPLYATGIGKLLLAHAPSGFLERYLRRVKLEPMTRKTVRTKEQLREQLARTREAGLAISIDEMAEGGSALAAPVFDRTGKVMAALVIAVPTSRMAAHRALLTATLKDGAKKLSALV